MKQTSLTVVALSKFIHLTLSTPHSSLTPSCNYCTLPSMKMCSLSIRLGILLLATSACAAERPNILWITSEDNGVSWVSSYGGTNAQTPNID